MSRGVARLVCLLGILGLATPGLASSPEPFVALGLVPFESGIKAPEFTLPDLDGNPVSVSSRPGPAAILTFWATW